MAPETIRSLRLPADDETQRFTTAWVAALSAIALLAIAGGVLVQATIRAERSESTLQNLVAEQRVRVLTMSAEADRLTRPDLGPGDVRAAVSTIESELADVRATNDILLFGDEALGVDTPSQELASELGGARVALDRMGTATDRLMQAAEVSSPEPDVLLTHAAALLTANERYLDSMERTSSIVFSQTQDRLGLARQLQVSILVALLALLVIEALLIFRPATRRIRARIEAGNREREVERRRTQDQLELLARYDHLTGLANRVLFRDRLDHAVAAAERSSKAVALMFLDLDKFKDINDQFGHDAGDQLLIEVAARVSECARRSDTVARLGGDEFTLILEGLESADGAANVAQKILDVMSEPFELAGRQVKMTTSIGIAMFPQDARDVEDLLRAADSAMYQAKGAGRATFQFSTPELRASNVARLQLINELRRGVKGGDLRLVYQPQIEIETGQVVAVEAFVRWRRPDGSDASAAEFIEVAEDTDLMVPLGDWAVREAAKQSRLWRDEGLAAIRIALNLSSRQFRQLNLATSIAGALNELGMPPSLLELEVTEDTLVEDVDAATVTLRLLKGIGVRIVIDDFGTGYSSINYLKQFPIDALKIDSTFLQDVTDDHSEENVVPAAIAGLARHLGIQTVAEGVETREQLDFLRRIHCDLAQGYLISAPLEADEIPALIRRRSIVALPDVREERGGAS